MEQDKVLTKLKEIENSIDELVDAYCNLSKMYYDILEAIKEIDKKKPA